jgi:hypothetical protein
VLDVQSRCCSRTTMMLDKMSIVDPRSGLFQRVRNIFDGFESPAHILVTQLSNTRSRLQVKLTRLDLEFFVSSRKTLRSRKLGVDIDFNQDIGVWHGLQGKLLCTNFEDIADPLANQVPRQMVLVPIGKLSVVKDGCHIAVRCNLDGGEYAKYPVNRVLGCLDCAAEPLMIYHKAQLDAFTSFLLPDSLTGRTGTEEALDWLSSGICQPWLPLKPRMIQHLLKIAEMSPRRDYYPSTMKVMQREAWSLVHSVSAQADELRPAVDRILKRSRDLSVFYLNEAAAELEAEGGQASKLHLRARGSHHRALFHRATPDTTHAQPEDEAPAIKEYESRDDPQIQEGRHLNTMEMATLVREWPERLTADLNLAAALTNNQRMTGYQDKYSKVLLSERLDTNVVLE